MNSKSLLFIFALLALFTLSSANVIAEKRDLDDDELLSDALSLMQKLIRIKDDKEKQKIAESLKTDDDDLEEEEIDEEPVDLEPPEGQDDEEVDEEPVEQEPPVDLEPPTGGKYIVALNDDEDDESYANNNGLGPDEDVEVITVTVEIEEGEEIEGVETVNNPDGVEVDVQLGTDLSKNVVAADINVPVDGVTEDAPVDGVADEEVTDEIDLDETEDITQNPEADIEYDIDINDVETPKDETKHYNVEEGEYNEEEGAYETVVTLEEEEGGNAGVVGTVAVVGAFGVIAGLGYKYTQRKKRVLLPFHEDLLEKDGFYDNAEQHIIPVWAATCKKEENEEEKEEEEKLFEVVYNYEPELPDELKLTVGDKIKIKEIYEDGWAYGYNKTTQLFGTFPSTSLGEDFNPESVPQYKPEEVAVDMNDNMVEELKKKIVESN